MKWIERIAIAVLLLASGLMTGTWAVTTAWLAVYMTGILS